MHPSTHAPPYTCTPLHRPSGYESLADILVVTPGRLIDHIHNTPGFDLTHLRFLVIRLTLCSSSSVGSSVGSSAGSQLVVVVVVVVGVVVLIIHLLIMNFP